MPDLDILIGLADFYEVDIRELIDGEKNGNMDKETEETVLKAAFSANVQELWNKEFPHSQEE